jgi:hypothetical protein
VKQILGIIALVFLISCGDNHHVDDYCYTNIFKHINRKNQNDTIKFYGFTNIDKALICAKAKKKRLLLIFSGWGCVANPGREWETLANLGDNDFIQNNFIITWLPVDDNDLLADTTKIDTVHGDSIRIKTIGTKNIILQIKLAQSTIQPWLCCVDTNLIRHGNTMIAWSNDKKEIKGFLMNGLKE